MLTKRAAATRPPMAARDRGRAATGCPSRSAAAFSLATCARSLPCASWTRTLFATTPRRPRRRPPEWTRRRSALRRQPRRRPRRHDPLLSRFSRLTWLLEGRGRGRRCTGALLFVHVRRAYAAVSASAASEGPSVPAGLERACRAPARVPRRERFFLPAVLDAARTAPAVPTATATGAAGASEVGLGRGRASGRLPLGLTDSGLGPRARLRRCTIAGAAAGSGRSGSAVRLAAAASSACAGSSFRRSI